MESRVSSDSAWNSLAARSVPVLSWLAIHQLNQLFLICQALSGGASCMRFGVPCRRIYSRTVKRGFMSKHCSHIAELHPVEPHTPSGCEECLQTGGRWVHLRLCLSCGHVGCCDSSPGKH